MATSLHSVQGYATIKFRSFIRGYHVYQTTWAPNMGNVQCFKHEPSNCNDRFAIVIINGSPVVGHLLYNMAPTISYFLMKSMNKGKAVVTGQRNRSIKRKVMEKKFPVSI